jgi:hypothetical protein
MGSFKAAFVVNLPQPSLTLNSPQSGMAEGASDAAQSNKGEHWSFASETWRVERLSTARVRNPQES